MTSFRRELASILKTLGLPPSARRSITPPASPVCESLEGRQLLTGGMGFSGMGMGGMGMGGPADVSAMGGGETGFSSELSNFGSGMGGTDLFGGMSSGSDWNSSGMSTQTSDLSSQASGSTSSSLPDFADSTDFSNFGSPGQFGGMSGLFGGMMAQESGTTTPVDASTSSSVTPSVTASTTSTTPTSVASPGMMGMPMQMAGMGGQFDSSSSFGGPDISNTGSVPSFGQGVGGAAVALTSFGLSTPGGGMSSPVDSSTDATASDATSYLEQQYSGMGLGGGPGVGISGVTGPVGQASTTPASGTTTTSSTQLPTDLQQLQTDLQTIEGQSGVSPAMMTTVHTDLNAVKGAETTTPSASTLTTLQTDLKTAETNTGGATAAQLAQVQTDQDAVYESQGVSSTLVGQLDTDLGAIQTAFGLTAADQATIAADQAAIQADLPSTSATAATTSTSTTPSTASTTSST
jgi:hypothetical protein